jgi:hypothetical protein
VPGEDDAPELPRLRESVDALEPLQHFGRERVGIEGRSE